MKSVVCPELPTVCFAPVDKTPLGSTTGLSPCPQASTVDNSAPFVNRPQSTYKSGNAVQTTGATSLYGGIPIKQLGFQNYRRCVGTVMQEDTLMTGSISDNISFFDIKPNLENIHACATLAAVHEDISRMPMGYQTLVGDMGSSLSGGQKQRLLLARALYKKPKILALDEATSHLDITNEIRVTQALTQLTLTRIIVAHRPETIAGAQRVVELHEGAVNDVL